MVFVAREFVPREGFCSDLADVLHAGPWPTVASVGGALLTGIVLWFDLPTPLVLGWAALVALSHGVGFAFWRACQSAPRDPAMSGLWLGRLTLNMLGIGIAWGALAIAFVAGTGGASQAFIYGIVVAIMAGAAVVNCAHVPSADAIIWPASVPIALASWWLGDVPHLAAAALLLLFAVGMSIVSRRMHGSIAQASASRFECERLAARLAATNSCLAAANAELALARERLEIANADLARAHAEAAAASRSKSEFLANMSHELRTPLNAIIGFAEVIERETFGPTGQRYREYAGDIHGSGRHLLQVINDILDLAKVEAGQMQLHEARVDAALVMQGCLRLIKPRAAQSNVRLQTAFDTNLPVLLADEARLRQIGLNLMSNAVKFTKAGGRVSISTGLDGDGGIVIAVTDTGIGMTADEIAIALEPFRQVTSSLSRTNEGTGLGLPLTKTLVELHGGRLDITSVPGRGTTVTVTFPASRSLAQHADVAV